MILIKLNDTGYKIFYNHDREERKKFRLKFIKSEIRHMFINGTDLLIHPDDTSIFILSYSECIKQIITELE